MASPKVPGALRTTTSDIRGGRYPKALLVGVVSWVLVAVVLLVSRLGAPQPTDAQETNQATGVQAVAAPSAQDQWFVPWLPVLGIVVLLAAVGLFAGVGLFRLVLAILGMLAVIGLASAASWLAVPAGVLWVIGCVCGVLIPVHRYLTQTRAAAASAGPPRGSTTP